MLKQRASKKVIILLFIIAFSTFIVSPINVRGQEETTATIGDQAFIINPDWLSVQATEFNGKPLDYTGKQDRLNIDIGGYGMTNFINHGEVAYDKETDTHVYMAEMDFPVWAVVYTDCMITDVYPNYITDTKSHEWLELTTMQHWAGGVRQFWGDINHNTYDVTYNRIGTGVVDTQEYDGNLRLNVIINPDLPIDEGGVIYINGVEFNVPNIRVFIESANLIERSYGVCDDPQNFYTENDGVIEVRKENLVNTDFSQGKSSAKDECGAGLDHNYPDNMPYAGRTTAEDEISWAGVHDITRFYGVTYTTNDIGQAFASSPAVGTTWSRSDDLNDYDEIFNFDTHIRIKPNMFYDMERFDIRHTYLYVDRYKETVFPDYGLCDIKDEYVDTHTRIIGLGVQNIFIKMEYNFKVTMLLAIQPTSEEGQDILEDPEVYQGDIIWDNTIGGTTDAKATVAQPSGWGTDLADSWNKFWSDTGAWFDDQLNWLKDMAEQMADEWYDWWDNLPNILSDWWQNYWWILVIIAVAFFVIIGFFLFYRKIARGTVEAYHRHKELSNENQPIQ